jgi:response regulator RpfG family c-di-GMP phosphodiesterase
MQIRQITMLCVDDEPGILSALRRTLCNDFTIVTAESVKEGMKALADNPIIDLVLSDYRMPGVNGFDFLTWCQHNFPHIVRYALTGYPDSDLMKEALQSGLVSRVFAKPWDNDQLVSTLKKAIEDQGICT